MGYDTEDFKYHLTLIKILSKKKKYAASGTNQSDDLHKKEQAKVQRSVLLLTEDKNRR